jgi:hypothetical protein
VCNRNQLHGNDQTYVSLFFSLAAFLVFFHHVAARHQTSVVVQNALNPSTHVKSLATSNIPSVNHSDASTIKNGQRRKKGPGHRRNNSKGSVTSWTPPSLSAIAAQEDKRASIGVSSDVIDGQQSNNSLHELSNETLATLSMPSISGDVDSNASSHHHSGNGASVKLDANHSISSSTTFQRPTTLFTYIPRKSSSSDPEDFNIDQYHGSTRQRRRRTFNINNNRVASPSSNTSRSIKAFVQDALTPQVDESTRLDTPNEHEKTSELRKNTRTVSFQFLPSVINERTSPYSQRKTFARVSQHVT